MWEADRVDQWRTRAVCSAFPLFGSKQIYPVYPRGPWIYHTCPARSPGGRVLPWRRGSLPPSLLPLPRRPLSLTCLVVDLCVHGQAGRRAKKGSIQLHLFILPLQQTNGRSVFLRHFGLPFFFFFCPENVGGRVVKSFYGCLLTLIEFGYFLHRE